MTEPSNARPAFANWLSTTNEITLGFLSAGKIPGLINLAGGLPAPESFPVPELADLARQAVERHPQDCLGYGAIEGLPELRDHIASRYATDDLRLNRDNVLITTGSMQALELLGKVLLENGGLIAGQFPTYLGALDVWRPRQPTYRPVRLDANDFDAQAALTGAQFAYTVPNFSNPTGKLVGLPVREALVEAAHQTGTWLIEDDPYGSLYFDGPPLPRMLGLSAIGCAGREYDGPVIYTGTISKQIAPGLRVGWVIAAPVLIKALTLAKQGSDLGTSGLTQRIVLAAFETGLVDRLQPKIVDHYRQRRDVLLAAMTAHLTPWFTFEKPPGGMFAWAEARDPAFDSDKLLPLALAGQVGFTPSSVFDPAGENRRAIRLNFSFNPPDRLTEGVRRLAAVIAAFTGQKG